MAFTFIFGSGLSGPISEAIGKRATLAASSICVGVALWLAGGLRINSEVVTWVGLGLNGFFVAGPIILTIPEVLDSMT